jgi:hypothetical protein
MKNGFIPYEQALVLKELGFDKQCFAKYFQQNGNTPFIQIGETEIGEAENAGDDVTFECDAPLYQQAFSHLLNHEMIIDKGYQLVEESRGNWGMFQEKENHFELILSGVPKIECLKELIGIALKK